MAKLMTILAIIGIAYWYWSGPSQQSANAPATDDPKHNADIMQRCIAHESRMNAAGGMAGLGDVGASGQDAEQLCADEYNLYKRDGQWYSR